MSLPASSRAANGTYKPKIEVLGDEDSDTDSDASGEDEMNDQLWAKPSLNKPRLIEVVEPSDIVKTRKLVEEINDEAESGEVVEPSNIEKIRMLVEEVNVEAESRDVVELSNIEKIRKLVEEDNVEAESPITVEPSNIEKTRKLVEEVNIEGECSEAIEPSDIEKTMKLVEEVNIEGESSEVTENRDHSTEILHGMDQLINNPGPRKIVVDFSEDEKKYAAMSKEEKIQDLAENMGTARGQKYDNKDVWSPDDELD